MAKLTAPKGWSEAKQNELYTCTEKEYACLPAYYREKFDDCTIDMGLSPRTVLRREWDDIQFNIWADEKAKTHYE